MKNPEPQLENETPNIVWDFHIKTRQLILVKRPDLVIVNYNKRTYRILNFAVAANNRVKFKESEKKDKYLDLSRKLKKLSNMKVTEIPIAIGALGTVSKRLV